MDKPPSLIVPRRNFLVRAFGLTAAGATMAVPVVAMESPVDRLNMHMRGAADAMRDMFPGFRIEIKGNCNTVTAQQGFLEASADGRGAMACMFLFADGGLDNRIHPCRVVSGIGDRHGQHHQPPAPDATRVTF